MAKKCARTFSIVVEKGKKSILDVGHLLPVGTCSGEIRAQCRNRAKSTGRRAGRPHRVRTAPPLRRCSAPTLTVGSARFQRGVAELQRPQLRH